MTSICIAGVTGWVGAPLAQAVLEAEDLTLSGAVARSAAGRRVEGSDLTIAGSVAEALEAASHTDVLIDYTAPDAVRGHIEEALRHGVGVVVGTSGLTAEDYAQVDARPASSASA